MNKLYLLLFISALSMLSCNSDDDGVVIEENIPCENEVIDFETIYLSEESIGFIPYDGEESIIFKNRNGEEVKFEPLYPPISHSFRYDEFELNCEGGEVNEYIYKREQYAVSHKCEELNLQYYLNVYSYNSSEYPEFVDKFSLLFHEPPLDNIIDTVIRLNIITNFRDKENLLADEFETDNKYQFVTEVELLNEVFSNVYLVKEPIDNLLTELYFSKEIGILGFKDLTLELWVFDRVE